MIFIRKLFLIATLLGLMFIVHELKAPTGGGTPLSESALALGFLLLFAFLLGRITFLLKAPMITGFLIAGVIAGPFGIGIVSHEGAEPLRLVDSLALALIAFSAGSELNIPRFGPHLKSLMWMMGAQTFYTFLLVATPFAILFSITGFMGGSIMQGVMAAILLGVVATANSPATAIAVIAETKAKGPVSDLVIGVTVLKDVFVIALFGFAMSFASAMVGDSGQLGFGFAGHIGYEIAISIVVGGGAGMVMIMYLDNIDENVPVFIIGMGLVVVEICTALDIAPLLASITVGFIVENYSSKGEKLMDGLRTSSLPIFVVFFSLAGQGLDLDALFDMWPFALTLVALRALGTRIGSMYGAVKGGEGESIGRYAWTGFLGQAGVSLGFAILITRQFPTWGPKLATLIVAAVVINQLVGPILMKRSLGMAGETHVEPDEEDKP